ncbi:hypothetical protein HFO72_31270 [Rhizobium laguerreae]|uniref:hypothetical protein n=1 Tax=Rhizobium laguerreae TaxID=1076926 RepID=UPI001C923412|nr:hypothetical protein [Rhizobium laguerreae]MBY3095217.1 hypothetical protein [Rhizobium laguerreae]
MPKIFAAAVILLAILVGYSGATWQPQGQSDVASKEKKVPKTGYPDPFIPPTKGNGF